LKFQIPTLKLQILLWNFRGIFWNFRYQCRWENDKAILTTPIHRIGKQIWHRMVLGDNSYQKLNLKNV
jgi:hypothetical protein